jgi:branched-chain amino acid transport system substrate-binding protein
MVHGHAGAARAKKRHGHCRPDNWQIPEETAMPQFTRRHTTALIGSALLSSALPTFAQDKRPIKIGFSMALSGGLAGGGKAALLTYQIWAEEVNKKGGLLGRPVELVYYDDQSSPATVPPIYSKLLDIDKVDLVLSGYATVPTAAAMPTIIEHKKMFLSLFALGLGEQFKYDRYFQLQPNGPTARTEISKGFYEIAMTLDPKPKTIAIAGADAEYSQIAMEGARINAPKYGMKIVYDRAYPPNTVDFSSIMRAIKATNPELIFIASYPPDSAGMVRAAYDVGVKARLFGGGLIGVQFAAVKAQLNTKLNNVVSYDLYVPEPTMQFPGIDEFLVRYRQRASAAGVDALGIYIPPFAYAEMQILEQAINATGSLDDGKLAAYIHQTTFKTVVGDIQFEETGEWAKARNLWVQYRGVTGSDIEQFKQAGKQVILYPPQFKSGTVVTPFDATQPAL